MSETLAIGAYSVELSNTDKVFFPEAGITKGDLIDYYHRIAGTMLPYMQDRPVTMHRFPDGIDGDDFYQQNISDYFPDWITRQTVEKERGTVTHVICNQAATLVYLANQACITPHIWLSRHDKPHHPDRMIIDLDPPGNAVDRARQAALTVRELLAELDLRSFVMTTGSQGYHIVVPLDRSQAFDMVRSFARDTADLLAGRHPDRLTTAQRKAKRGDRVFLDTLRNSYAHTSAAPYAVRAKPGAPVAAPLAWDEMTRANMHPRHYTLHNIFRRLGQKQDPWHSLDDYAFSLQEPRRRLDDLLAAEAQ